MGLKEAREVVLRHCQGDGVTMHAMPGVHLMRFGWTSCPLVSLQKPCVAMVLQGAKSVEFGDKPLVYGAGQYMLASLDVPATSRIVTASRARPLLAAAMDIDATELRQAVERCEAGPGAASGNGLDVFQADAALIDAMVRMVGLLDTPQDARALAPLLRQEILYRLLTGPAGERMIELCRNGSPSNRIAEAAAWMREHFAESFLVEDVAHEVGMSPSAFHQQFKVLTGMTPIQYRIRLRLHQARRSLLLDALDIGEASFRAGYQSPSQFSKDYRRYFGRLPKDDVSVYAGGAVAIDAYVPEVRV